MRAQTLPQRPENRPRWLRATSLTMVWLAASGCAHDFKGVQAAGETGQKIAAYASAFDAASQLCLEQAAIANVAASCDRSRDEHLRQVTMALVAYAGKLATLAKAKDVTVTDQVSSVLAIASQSGWDSLTKDSDQAIAQFANAVVQVLSAQYRAGVLDDTIARVDPPLQNVVAALTGAIALQSRKIDLLGASLQSVVGVMKDSPSLPRAAAPKSETPPNRDQMGLNLALLETSAASVEMLKHDLDLKRQAYSDLATAIDAFGKAHAMLAKHVHDLQADAVLEDVLSVVKAAYAAYHSVQTTKAANTLPSSPPGAHN